MKYERLNLLEPSGSHRACYRTAYDIGKQVLVVQFKTEEQQNPQHRHTDIYIRISH